MQQILGPERERDLLARGFSRRSFFKVASLMGAASSVPFFSEAAFAQLSSFGNEVPPDAVLINANENPLGPCPQAIEAATGFLKQGGRYHFELTSQLRDLLAQQEGLSPEQVQIFAGSSPPLTQAVISHTSPTRSFVTGDPGYEAGEAAARFIGAKVHRVPLTKSYSHDVRAMAAADPNAGLFYICNPNNPTGTLTPDKDLDWLVDNMPKGAVLLLDEAYTHFAGCKTRADLVASGKPVIVLRTFSKLYGLAGLRAGAAFAQPETLNRLSRYSQGIMPTTGISAAIASLQASDLVPTRRKIVADTRAETFKFLDKHGFSYVPSVSNKFLLDVKQPGERIAAAMRKDKVFIGRTWPSWPTYVRVTIGTPQEMEKFQAAFLKVMA
ncbi:MAG TPA: pyridoxal phosphate-dependent aminotransferase [Planctomycetaceae bacterium]|jgi:histidinol-phosphate aminotransferase|nr:pyridoxal phosphate-dependent aminotransferase [Planctomycetaceae bacterium]